LEAEHVIERQEIVNLLLKTLGIGADELVQIVSHLSDEGEIVRSRRSEVGKAPISYLSRCADFLEDWISVEGSSYAHYVKVVLGRDGKKQVRIGVRCLDPSLAASVTNKLRSAILMSGTLWHTNYYIDVLGIDGARCESIELPSPFPPQNRLIIVDKAVTTKFEKRGEQQWRRIADHLQKIVDNIRGRIAVYFPSYEVMQSVLNVTELDLPIIVEERTTKIVDVLQFLKSHERCAVFGVARGKIGEGVDMSLEGRTMLSAVIVVGLPYPKRTELQKALLGYFREKFGKRAMEYANDIPCLNALAQCAGRLLRSPQDRGIIVIMDSRATGKFKHRLPKEWQKEMKAHLKIEKITETIIDFSGHDPNYIGFFKRATRNEGSGINQQR
jgi:DNA excision repair protein ERCC-2